MRYRGRSRRRRRKRETYLKRQGGVQFFVPNQSASSKWIKIEEEVPHWSREQAADIFVPRSGGTRTKKGRIFFSCDFSFSSNHLRRRRWLVGNCVEFFRVWLDPSSSSWSAFVKRRGFFHLTAKKAKKRRKRRKEIWKGSLQCVEKRDSQFVKSKKCQKLERWWQFVKTKFYSAGSLSKIQPAGCLSRKGRLL